MAHAVLLVPEPEKRNANVVDMEVGWTIVSLSLHIIQINVSNTLAYISTVLVSFQLQTQTQDSH